MLQWGAVHEGVLGDLLLLSQESQGPSLVSHAEFLPGDSQ